MTLHSRSIETEMAHLASTHGVSLAGARKPMICKVRPTAAERRLHVPKMVRNGMSYQAIGDVFGVSKVAIFKDVRALRQRGEQVQLKRAKRFTA